MTATPIRKTSAATKAIQRSPVQTTADYGSDLLTDTAEHTGRWRRLRAIGGAVTLTGLVSETFLDDTKFSGYVIPENAELEGVFTSVTRASGGDLLAYA